MSPAEAIRVFVVDDHEVLRTRLRRMCETHLRLTLVGEAATANDALERMARLGVDVAVIGLWHDGRCGVALCEKIVVEHPGVRCIVLSSPLDGTTIFDAIASGASAFLRSQMRATALVGAIRAVAGGGSLLAVAPKRQLMRRVEELRRASLPDDAQIEEMTERPDMYPPAVSVDIGWSNEQGPTPGSTERAWKMAPELELLIDIESTPATVRLVGALDGETGKHLRSVIEELANEGCLDFAMQVEGLQLPDPAGFSSLVGIQRLIKGLGGSISWSRWANPTE